MVEYEEQLRREVLLNIERLQVGRQACHVVPCSAVRCGAVQCGAVRCGAVRCPMEHRSATPATLTPAAKQLQLVWQRTLHQNLATHLININCWCAGGGARRRRRPAQRC